MTKWWHRVCLTPEPIIYWLGKCLQHLLRGPQKKQQLPASWFSVWGGARLVGLSPTGNVRGYLPYKLICIFLKSRVSRLPSIISTGPDHPGWSDKQFLNCKAGWPRIRMTTKYQPPCQDGLRLFTNHYRTGLQTSLISKQQMLLCGAFWPWNQVVAPTCSFPMTTCHI